MRDGNVRPPPLPPPRPLDPTRAHLDQVEEVPVRNAHLVGQVGLDAPHRAARRHALEDRQLGLVRVGAG